MPDSIQKRHEESSNLADMANFFNNYSDSNIPARCQHKEIMPEQLEALNSRFEFCFQGGRKIKFQSRVHTIFTQELPHLAETLVTCKEPSKVKEPQKEESKPLDNRTQTGLSIT